MGFSEILLEWFAEHGRNLPWRNSDNPYHIWVSEVILQQTRVSQGMSYYLAFIERFPTVQALADAPLDDVMKCWQGLGYYTRARNLHKGAQLVMSKYGGIIPDEYSELIKIPGLGPYAAGAVASFAFHRPEPAIDGNVYRVLSRIFGVFDSPGKAAGKRAFRTLTLELMDKERPQEFNQALLDFGALQCTPGRPNCGICPFRGMCYAEENDLQMALPRREREVRLRVRHLHFIVLIWRGDTFIELRQGKDIWHSLYQFPLVESEGPLSVEDVLRREEVAELAGEGFKLLHVSEERRQLLSHQELFARFYIIEPSILPYATLDGYRRVPLEDLEEYQVPVMIENYLVAEEAAPYFCTPRGEEKSLD